MAGLEAAYKLITEMKRRAGIYWNIEETDIKFSEGNIYSTKDPELKLSIKELASVIGETGGPISSTSSVNLPGGGNGFGIGISDIQIDTLTGKTDVVRYTAIQDVGKAIYPQYVESQIAGGAVQGIGWALNEEYYMNDKGIMTNSSFLDYRMPTSLDLPNIEVIIVEVANPQHPYGVRGVGEVPIIPPLATLANAIKDAIGTRIYSTPMNPGKILEVLSSG